MIVMKNNYLCTNIRVYINWMWQVWSLGSWKINDLLKIGSKLFMDSWREIPFAIFWIEIHKVIRALIANRVPGRPVIFFWNKSWCRLRDTTRGLWLPPKQKAVQLYHSTLRLIAYQLLRIVLSACIEFSISSNQTTVRQLSTRLICATTLKYDPPSIYPKLKAFWERLKCMKNRCSSFFKIRLLFFKSSREACNDLLSFHWSLIALNIFIFLIMAYLWNSRERECVKSATQREKRKSVIERSFVKALLRNWVHVAALSVTASIVTINWSNVFLGPDLTYKNWWTTAYTLAALQLTAKALVGVPKTARFFEAC